MQKIITFTFLLFFISNISQAQDNLKQGDLLPANLFVELAKAINPAVVNISTTQMPRGRQYQDPLLQMFEQLWGQGAMPQSMRPAHSLGTGFIIRADGLILTNNHVIEQADIIRVQLSEKDENFYEAKIIGRDQRTDIALVKISAGKKLPIAKLGSSKNTEVGEWVAAFGNPYGYGHTMTKGIISAKGRDLDELNKFPFLQTDASINPGNSGGPLVNTKGEVIGVNTAIDGRAQGIGFAIPIDEVKSILPDLESKGRIQRGYLGISMVDVNARAARSLGLEKAEGVLIAEITPSSPADQADLHPYDVIIKFNNKNIRNKTELQQIVNDATVGGPIPLTVIRDGIKKDLAIVLEPKKAAPKEKTSNKATTSEKSAPYSLGFKITTLTKDIADELGARPSLIGKPIVTEVSSNSPAGVAGLGVGDIILDINRQPVKSIKDVNQKLKKGGNLVRIVRGNFVGVMFIEVGK